MYGSRVSPAVMNVLENIADMTELYMDKIEKGKDITYKHEAGVIVGDNGAALHMIIGTTGAVEFPHELIWNLHKKRPGSVFKLAHTHPLGMARPSGRDLQTLETWAWALHPFPARLSVVTESANDLYVENTWISFLESKEQWQEHGGERKITTMQETQYLFTQKSLLRSEPADAYLLWLLEESYGLRRFT